MVTAFPQPVEHGLTRAVRLLLVRQVIQRLGRRALHAIVAIHAFQHDQTVEHDAAIGDRAGLVEIEAVHASQRLHRFEFLHERVLAGKPHRRDREVERGEQYQAFGNHADNARYS